MDGGADPPSEPSIGELFHQLVDDGKDFARAELNLYRQIALYRASRARNGVVALVAAVVLANAALIAFLAGVVLGLAPLVGPVAAGLIVLAVVAIIGYLLVRYGLARIASLAGDEEERQALLEGERRA